MVYWSELRRISRWSIEGDVEDLLIVYWEELWRICRCFVKGDMEDLLLVYWGELWRIYWWSIEGDVDNLLLVHWEEFWSICRWFMRKMWRICWFSIEGGVKDLLVVYSGELWRSCWWFAERSYGTSAVGSLLAKKVNDEDADRYSGINDGRIEDPPFSLPNSDDIHSFRGILYMICRLILNRSYKFIAQFYSCLFKCSKPKNCKLLTYDILCGPSSIFAM